jgi:signal transduction histidine kinase
MLERLRPDRQPNRDLVWQAADVLLVVPLTILVVQSMRSDPYREEIGTVTSVGWLWVLGPTMLLTVRRTVPLTALVAATVMYLVAGIDNGDGNAILAAPFLAYMVALSRPPRVSAAIVGVAGTATSLTGLYGPGPISLLTLTSTWIFFAIGSAVGVRVRGNQIAGERLAAEAQSARDESIAIAARAVADERARLARELHDAVGHAVNVMVMQAGAARMVSNDEHSLSSFRAIERVGRLALTDLDRMLGLLRTDSETSLPLEPTHGLSDIAALVERVGSTAITLDLRDDCTHSGDCQVDNLIGSTAYRVVQEALTNVVKHAGPSHVDVVIRRDDDHLVVSVTDDGRGTVGDSARPGHGIVGMRERVALVGGQLTAGPRQTGGFAVMARLPLGQELR